MILIAHRGNINGPIPERENSIAYIKEALAAGYDVEIDLWYIADMWMLGHDYPQYQVDLDFLRTRGLWIHCKNFKTLDMLARQEVMHPNFFYHTDEDYVLTKHGWIWAYPNKEGSDIAICVMPELNESSVEGFAGVCSDYVAKYKK